jgi:hypothetical protein
MVYGLRYGTSHFHQFSSYKFSINLIKSVFWITFGQESWWGGGEAVFLKKNKKIWQWGSVRQCATEITVDNSDEFGWGSGDSSVSLWPASSPAPTPIMMKETFKRNSGNSPERTSVGEFQPIKWHRVHVYKDNTFSTSYNIGKLVLLLITSDTLLVLGKSYGAWE